MNISAERDGGSEYVGSVESVFLPNAQGVVFLSLCVFENVFLCKNYVCTRMFNFFSCLSCPCVCVQSWSWQRGIVIIIGCMFV